MPVFQSSSNHDGLRRIIHAALEIKRVPYEFNASHKIAINILNKGKRRYQERNLESSLRRPINIGVEIWEDLD